MGTPGKKKKDSVSVNAFLGADLFRMLERLCEETGQSKTVAVEWAIRAYCADGADDGHPRTEDGS